MKTFPLAAAPLFSAPAWAAYQYYFTDQLTTVDTAKWSTAGQVTPGSAGLATPDTNGGSLISRVPIPDGSAEAEVRMTVTLTTSGGSYTEFLQATPDARTGSNGSGSYIAFEMQNPQFDASGHCAATFVLLQSSAGTATLLASFQHACRNGMTLRLAIRGGQVLVWPDESTPMPFTGVTAAPGQPGIGSYATPAGNAISQVQFGPIDRVVPSPIDQQKLTLTVFRKHVDLQWPAAADDANGSGLAGYQIYRDGLYLAQSQATQFSDETVASGGQYGYTIYSVDQHANQSAGVTANVSVPVPVLKPTPPLPFRMQPLSLIKTRSRLMRPDVVYNNQPMADSGGGLDPRRVGVRALGTYWGGAGEQIDTVSGNVNF
jgi:hypothetical protein